jgi:hypothetical protein
MSPVHRSACVLSVPLLHLTAIPCGSIDAVNASRQLLLTASLSNLSELHWTAHLYRAVLHWTTNYTFVRMTVKPNQSDYPLLHCLMQIWKAAMPWCNRPLMKHWIILCLFASIRHWYSLSSCKSSAYWIGKCLSRPLFVFYLCSDIKDPTNCRYEMIANLWSQILKVQRRVSQRCLCLIDKTVITNEIVEFIWYKMFHRCDCLQWEQNGLPRSSNEKVIRSLDNEWIVIHNCI